MAPYGAFRCKDSIIQVAVGSEGLWRKFAPLVEIEPDDPLFADNAHRVRHRRALIELINDAFTERNVDDLLAELDKAGVPARRGAHLDASTNGTKPVHKGSCSTSSPHTLGHITLPGPPLRLDGGEREHHLAPPPGQHNDSVRAWLDELDGSQSPTRS